ncbi:MAG TPA: nitroreductase/quinone reductase family protein [Acidimicrobiia bacterium]
MIRRVNGDPQDPAAHADEDFCYLTTVGRRTGRLHTIEIWFAVDRGVVYMMAGGREHSDWVRNLLDDPSVHVRIGDVEWEATARVVAADTEEDARVRPLLRDKYANASDDLVSWARTALPVAIELRGSSG